MNSKIEINTVYIRHYMYMRISKGCESKREKNPPWMQIKLYQKRQKKSELHTNFFLKIQIFLELFRYVFLN